MSDSRLFETDGLFATVDTLPTTPIDEISLPREIITRRCYCPDDCVCTVSWRRTICGCTAHGGSLR